jgi:copper homeostasis protein
LSMQSRYILEISVESIEAAMAAERGGSDRIEFCSNAGVGGTTPSDELLRAVRERVSLPIFSMVRPRGGDFFYCEAEFEAMRRDIDAAKKFGMDGVVLGLLSAGGEIDVKRSTQLVERAGPLHVTSGGKPTAPEALAVLGELVRIAEERLIVLPGSGIHAGNIREVVQKTGASEYHAGLSSVVANATVNIRAFEEEVRRLATALRDCE